MSGPVVAGMALSDIGEGGIMRIAASDGGVPFSQEHVGTFHEVVPHAGGAMERAVAQQSETPAVTQTADLDLTNQAKLLTPEIA